MVACRRSQPHGQKVLLDIKVNRCTRRCFAEDRPLREGESYFSVVIEQGDDLIRRDYSASAWTSPPEGTLGWWKGQMPSASAVQWVLAPDSVLVDLLRQLGGPQGVIAADKSESGERRTEGDNRRDRVALRYLLAILLLRRRVVRMADTRMHEDAEPGDSHSESMRLEVVTDGSEIDVETCPIARSDLDRLQAAMHELLYCEASP